MTGADNNFIMDASKAYSFSRSLSGSLVYMTGTGV